MSKDTAAAARTTSAGIQRVYKIDQTALFFDARSADDFAKASLPGSHNVPANQLAAGGLRNAPMPSNDFNTRIILFGNDGAQARELADAIGKTAMQKRLVLFRHVNADRTLTPATPYKRPITP